MYLYIMIIVFIVHSSFGHSEEIYPDSIENIYELDGNLDNEYGHEMYDFEIPKSPRVFYPRDKKSQNLNGDFEEDFIRPTRSGGHEKSDHYIRFGRDKQNFLRFGRRDHKIMKGERSTLGVNSDSDSCNDRRKRETKQPRASGNNFLRFGRNSNFMRFGRNHGLSISPVNLESVGLSQPIISSKWRPRASFTDILLDYLEN